MAARPSLQITCLSDANEDSAKPTAFAQLGGKLGTKIVGREEMKMNAKRIPMMDIK